MYGKHKRSFILPVFVDLKYIDNLLLQKRKRLLSSNKFNILFYGHFIPLQGVDCIVGAATLLKSHQEFCFTVIGSATGKCLLERKKIIQNANKFGLNINFIDEVDYDHLIYYIFDSQLCLGIFGGTRKSKRVIPNKIIDYMACGKTVICGENNEMKKYFQHGESIIFCKMNDPHDLAKKIKDIYKRNEMIYNIGNKAKNIVQKKFNTNRVDEIISKIYENNR